jgi:hypothetical protein
MVSRLLRTILLLPLLTVLCWQCGGDRSPTTASPTTTTPVSSLPVRSISVSQSSAARYGTVELPAGARVAYSAFATLQDGSVQICAAGWVSSNPPVATVDSTGVVSGVSAGEATLSATCSGVTGSTTVTVLAGAALTGTVTEINGTPVASANVVVLGSPTQSGTTDDNGEYRVTGLARGRTFDASVSRRGYEITKGTVSLTAAENRQNFTLVPGVEVWGFTLLANGDPIPGATVEIVSGADTGKRAVTEVNGSYWFYHLQPGPMTLRASKAGYDTETQSVVVLENTRVQFYLKASHGSCLTSVFPLVFDRYTSAGGEEAIRVEANPGSAWTATADQAWIGFPLPPGGTGPGTLRIRIQPAPADRAISRTAIVRVGCSPTEGDNVKVTQLLDCKTTVAWAPGTPPSFPASGGTAFTVLVRTAAPGCLWDSKPQADWFHTAGPSSALGDYDVTIVALSNTSPSPRVGVIVFGETPLEVRQDGVK